MTSKCPYRDIFGKSGTGAHAYRFLDVAIVDYILTIFLAAFLTKLIKIPFEISTIIVFVSGIILHALVGVNTGAVKFLGLARAC